NIARRARSLDSWKKYRAAGVNLALGSDTYPRDLVMQMRIASYFGKVMSHDLFAASAAEVFEAATLGGARALGRDDLGRLAPGARADIVLIDLATRDALRFGPVRDPIKALVECGIGDDVVTVIVDGVVRMRDRVIPFAPGGPTDTAIRIIQPQLAANLGAAVVLVNKPGGGGAVGMDGVAKARPDGYTLAATVRSTLTILPASQPDVTYKIADFAV